MLIFCQNYPFAHPLRNGRSYHFCWSRCFPLIVVVFCPMQPTAVTVRTSLLQRALPNQLPQRTTHQKLRLPLHPSVMVVLHPRAISTTSRVTPITTSTERTTEGRHVFTNGVSRRVSLTKCQIYVGSHFSQTYGSFSVCVQTCVCVLLNIFIHYIYDLSQLSWRRWAVWRGFHFFKRSYKTSGTTTSPSSLRWRLSTGDESAWRKRNKKVSQHFDHLNGYKT